MTSIVLKATCSTSSEKTWWHFLIDCLLKSSIQSIYQCTYNQSTGEVLPLLPLRYQHSASLLGFRWVVKRKMKESNPYRIAASPQFSRLLAVHSAASSKLNNGSWRSRTPTVVNCTPVFETGCRPLGSSFPNFGCITTLKIFYY